jgi:hypothetical protein
METAFRLAVVAFYRVFHYDDENAFHRLGANTNQKEKAIVPADNSTTHPDTDSLDVIHNRV